MSVHLLFTFYPFNLSVFYFKGVPQNNFGNSRISHTERLNVLEKREEEEDLGIPKFVWIH